MRRLFGTPYTTDSFRFVFHTRQTFSSFVSKNRGAASVPPCGNTQCAFSPQNPLKYGSRSRPIYIILYIHILCTSAIATHVRIHIAAALHSFSLVTRTHHQPLPTASHTHIPESDTTLCIVPSISSLLRTLPFHSITNNIQS